MRFIVYVGRAAGVCSLLSLAKIVDNVEGTMEEDGGLASLAISNAACTRYSHGVVELLTSTVLVCFCFWMRTAMFSTTERIHDHTAANQLLSAANFSVMVDRVPADCEHAELRRHFETFGAVVHIGVSRANRPLVLHLHRRATLQRAVQAAAVELVARVRSARELQRAASQGDDKARLKLTPPPPRRRRPRSPESSTIADPISQGHLRRAAQRLLARPLVHGRFVRLGDRRSPEAVRG